MGLGQECREGPFASGTAVDGRRVREGAMQRSGVDSRDNHVRR